MSVSTYVLNTERGRPASGVPVLLEKHSGEWLTVGEQVTDANGRIGQFAGGEILAPGRYRLTFRTGGPFFPEVSVVFQITDAATHYHVPLLLSSYGYTTY